MGSGLVVNGLSTGGEIYRLKADASMEQAKKLGEKDGLDQVYFSVGADKYVLQGDDLKLGEIREIAKKAIPSTVVMLDNQPVQIQIEGIDDEVSSVMDGFYQNGGIASASGTAIAVGVPLAGLSGLSWIVASKAGSKMGQALTTGGIYLGAAAVVGGAVGLAVYAGKSIYEGASNKALIKNQDVFHSAQPLNSQTDAKSAGRMSVVEKAQAAQEVATDIILDVALDALFE